MKDCTLKKNTADNLPISSITPFTLQDFPDFTACILWFSKCNFRCSYCYNIDLVKNKLKYLRFLEIEKFLIEHKNLLDGVVLSGGECTLFKNLPELIRYIRGFGYKVKLDTNGSNPKILDKLLEENLLDFISLDYKAPIYKYSEITKYNFSDNILRSLVILCNSRVNFEVRTTVHTDLLNEEDINNIIEFLEEKHFTGKYYVQNYMHQITLGELSPQKRALDLALLKEPKNFSIDFRNFH